MTAIQVTKLKLRCTAEQSERTRFAIEDGLRTSIPDDRRLVLLRKMRVTGTADALRPADRNAGIREAWLAAISGARHGGEDGAATANCVWFESPEEAEALLITRLLAGRAVDAWYWKLALPDWRGLPLTMWVPALISEAVSRRHDRRVLRIATCFIAAGASSLLADMLNREGPIAELSHSPRFEREARHRQVWNSSELAQFDREAAAALRSAVPIELQRVIAALLRAGVAARAVALAMVRAWSLKRSPALALNAARLCAISEEILECLARPDMRGSPRTGKITRVPPSKDAPSARLAEDVRADPTGKLQAEGAAALPPVRRRAPSSIQDAATADEPTPWQIEPHAQCRLSSAHAGLWLVIPSLIELGFREWLKDRPKLLGENPASELLREIGRHHHVPPDDPALLALAASLDPDARPDWTTLWRHGLDRWLRRTAGRRLHDLVNRPGELDFADQVLLIHFPPRDADIRLRRHCLDRDPGWTDWLGLSVRYNFGGAEDWL